MPKALRSILSLILRVAHRQGAVRQVVRLLGALQLDVQHRALLLVRLMTERDCDRHAVFRYGGIRKLVALLSSKTSSIRENAAGAIGNLAAGSAEVKDELRRAGAVPKLVSLLAGENEVLAEFSSGALMNMSLKNADNRQVRLPHTPLMSSVPSCARRGIGISRRRGLMWHLRLAATWRAATGELKQKGRANAQGVLMRGGGVRKGSMERDAMF